MSVNKQRRLLPWMTWDIESVSTLRISTNVGPNASTYGHWNAIWRMRGVVTWGIVGRNSPKLVGAPAQCTRKWPTPAEINIKRELYQTQSQPLSLSLAQKQNTHRHRKAKTGSQYGISPPTSDVYYRPCA